MIAFSGDLSSSSDAHSDMVASNARATCGTDCAEVVPETYSQMQLTTRVAVKNSRFRFRAEASFSRRKFLRCRPAGFT